jgi:Na+/H+ antiporter NhaA
VAALVALAWANWPSSSYTSTWRAEAPWSSALGLSLTWQDWINQGLLLVFFTVIGLEIRREITAGELRSVRRAAAPVVAALAGMAAPALIFVAAVNGGPGAGAWGVPMATDVAFALGALALIGSGSGRTRVFLMTLAVADDVASIVVLLVFYSHRTNLGWLVAGLGILAVVTVAWAGRWPVGPGRVLAALAAWWAMLHAGVEAAVVGVAVGTFGPHRTGPGRTPGWSRPGVRAWELRLEPAVNLVVLPLFALANVGVRLDGSTFTDGPARRVFLAVLAARLLGKPLGITGGTRLVGRVAPDASQPRIDRRQLLGLSTVASVGFTVSLLIVTEALPVGPLADAATTGLLSASVLGAAGATLILRTGRARPRARRSS